MKNQQSFFDNTSASLNESIERSLASIATYGQRYSQWCIAYSGGKDSTATVTFVAWAIKHNLVPPPEALFVLYSDTRLELAPLQQNAIRLLSELQNEGINTKVVMPAMNDRFFVYMLGYGVPPSSNSFRWCTPRLKIEPMAAALYEIACNAKYGEMIWNKRYQKFQYSGFGKDKILTITGVRLGESASRDTRITLSCSRDSGECGQGWMQTQSPQAVTDTLAPLLHWRLCHIYDWLYFENERHGYDVSAIADIYGEDDIRTGCIGCPLTSRDTALERLVKRPQWQYLQPLLELKPLYQKLKLAKNRLRKSEPEIRSDGTLSLNVQRLGPLSMKARAYGLEQVLGIQQRARVDLINAEEEQRILELWAENAWPRKRDGNEITGDVLIDALTVTALGDVVRQPLLLESITD